LEAPGVKAETEFPANPFIIPHELFEHRAVLYGDAQQPFSEADETYTGEILDFEFKPISGP
jgi:hypothetical protein